MNLIKQKDLNVLSLEKIKIKLDKKYGKITVQNEIKEIREELHLYETETNLVNNVIPKPEIFGESSRKNTYFLRPRYVPAERISNFSFGFIPSKENYNF